MFSLFISFSFLYFYLVFCILFSFSLLPNGLFLPLDAFWDFGGGESCRHPWNISIVWRLFFFSFSLYSSESFLFVLVNLTVHRTFFFALMMMEKKKTSKMKSRSISSWITSNFSKENKKKKSRISVSRRRSAPFNGTRGVKSVTNWYVGLSTDNRCFPFPPNIVITRLVCMCVYTREMIAPAKAAAAGPVKQNKKTNGIHSRLFHHPSVGC